MKSKFTRILAVALPLVMVIALAVTLIPASQPSADAAVTKLRFSTVATPRVGSGGKYWLTPDVDVGAIAITEDGRTMFAADVSTLDATASVDEPISGNVSAAATSINATVTANYRASGVVAIDSELIFYSSINATHLLNCTRAYADTTAALHLDGAAITEVPMVYKSADGGYTWSLLEGFLTAAASGNATTMDTSAIVDVAVSPEYSSDSTLFVATLYLVYQSVNGGTAFSSMAVPTGWVAATENITDMDVSLDEGGRLSVIIGSTTTAYAGEVYVYCPATTGMGWKAQRVNGSAAPGTKTEDVLAVAFTPNFATDGGIVAVTTIVSATENLTKMRLSFGNTRDGGGWDTSVGDAEFYHNRNTARPIVATRASFAFPEDFNIDSLTSNVAFVALTGAARDEAGNVVVAEAGDVFKASLLTGVPSDVEDLNVRGIVVATPTETDIWSIDISGDAEAANILVGLNDWDSRVSPKRWLTYYTTDSGATWLSARIKSPTGGDGTWVQTALRAGDDARTNVLMSPTDDTVAYATTKGAGTSALSRSADDGKSWNQISLIDYASSAGYAVTGYAPMGKGLVEMKTTINPDPPTHANPMHCHWLSADDGATYERVSSYVNPTLTKTMAGRKGVKGTDVVYLADSAAGKYWRSSDAGASFPRTVTAKYPGIKKDEIVDETTIYTVYETKGVWYTTTLGRPWVQATEGPPGALQDLSRCKAVEGVWLVPNAAGEVYLTIDDCKTFTKLGLNDPLANVEPELQFDDNYAKNHFVYAGVGYKDIAAGGLMRIEVNEDDPDSTEWVAVATETISENASIGKLSPGMGGVWTVTDGMPVDTAENTGGFWRSVNADADTEALYPPAFELVGIDRGLTAGQTIKGCVPPAPPPTSYFTVKGADYYNQVRAFMDTLSSPVTLVEPADKATAGIGLDLTKLTQTVVLSWETLPGARLYVVQVAVDEEFASICDRTTGYMGITETGTQSRWTGMMPGKTYYWRVRAEEPIWSPWSGTRSFTIKPAVPVEVPVVFDIIGPEVGATNVPVQPTFAWTEYKGAIGYEIALSEQADFSILEWSRTTEVTFFKAPDPLAYSTTYYWRVRGVTGPPAPAPPKGPPGAPKEGPPGPPKEGKPGGPPGGGPPPGAPPKEGPPPEEGPPPGPPGKPPKPPAMVVPTGPWVTGMFTTEARPVEVVPPVEVAPPAPPEVQVVEVPVAPAIPPALLWVIVAIGAVLLIALIVLIVRTRRVT